VSHVTSHQMVFFRAYGHAPAPREAAIYCGTVAGATAAAITTPLDVCKSHIMLAQTAEARQQYSCILGTARVLCKQHGARKLFAGLIPRSLWMAGGGLIFLGTYEWARVTLLSIHETWRDHPHKRTPPSWRASQ
jgi:hypothetical protein